MQSCINWLALTLTCAIASSVCAAEVNSKRVDDAVDRGANHLLEIQKADGSWETGGGKKANQWVYFGGETAAATYALLVSGQNPTNPKIQKAIEWLETHDAHGTYVVGLRAQVWQQIANSKFGKEKAFATVRDHDRDFVLYSRVLHGSSMGFYGYTYGDRGASETTTVFTPYDKKGPPEGAKTDRSNSQYGVLGAWGLEQAMAEIPTQYWTDEDAAWKKAQLSDGGWDYKPGGGKEGGATPTMTLAGVATLFITQDYVMRSNAHQFDMCKGGSPNPNIEKGLAWLDQHLPETHARRGWDNLYMLYGIERVGVASGRKYFGTLDWYQRGAAHVLADQKSDGGWGPPHQTAWALVFLCRGRAPVVMNKLQYQNATKGQNDPWNERPRDVANLAKWMKPHLETYLNWQVVNLKVDAEELHDAPILYISGSESLSLADDDIAKLRLFVEQGGMILGNADCGNSNFATSFKKLGAKLFPKYEFRRVPLSHPMYDEQFHAAKWKIHPVVESITNGVRELVMLIPDADPSRAWQTESSKLHEESFQLADNIFLYAGGKENLAHKGDNWIVRATGKSARELKVARLQLGDNWDPEPGAWRRLSAIMLNDHHLKVTVDTVKPDPGALAGYKVAHLTGTTTIRLSDAARKELRSFVDGGGTLLIDAAGGSGAFADSIEAELPKLFPKESAAAMAKPLPPTHAIYSDVKGQVRYRKFARPLMTGASHDPRVKGFALADGRIGAFYSREDLTAGAVGEPVDGILGYDNESATRILAGMLLYVSPDPKPATKPATPGPAKTPTTAPATTPASAPAAQPTTAMSAQPTTAPATKP